MLKATELRIGNIITIKHIKNWEGHREPATYEATVMGTDAAYIDVKALHQLGVDRKIPEEAFAIPLTPELLEKCGFDNGIKNSDKGGSIEVYLPNYEVFIGGSESFTDGHIYTVSGVKYLHQLQNLYLALAGEELSVNL